MPQLDNIELFEELLVLSLYFIFTTTLISLIFVSSDFLLYLNIYWFFFLSLLGLDYLLKISFVFSNFKKLQLLIIKNNFYLTTIFYKKEFYYIFNANLFNFFFNKYLNCIYLLNHAIQKKINSLYIILI